MQDCSFVSKCLVFLYTVICVTAVHPGLPNKPFYVVWNHPSEGCGNHIDFEKWGIVDNTKDKFMGDKMVIYYHLGKWPILKKGGNINGGIPQLINMTEHLNKVEADIKRSIPDPAFSGPAVIDQEIWRALWETNYSSFRKYQWAAMDLVRKNYPAHAKDKRWVLAEAAKEWDDAARKVLAGTLEYAMKLRPQAKWGYYGYPRTWGGPENTARVNDKMEYLWNTSSGIYPSIYIWPQSGTPAGHAAYIKSVVAEALRVQAKFSKIDAPVLPYTLSQNGPNYLFKKEDLELSIGQPANMGASGVVIWGASADLHRKNACNVLKDHVENTLGPYVLQLTNFFSNCTEKLCNGNGRCIRKDFQDVYKEHISARDVKEKYAGYDTSSTGKAIIEDNGNDTREARRGVGYDFDDYVCKCYKGFAGNNCDKKV